MPKTRAQKGRVIEELRAALTASPYAVFTDFTALTMTDLDSFRAKAREKGMRYNVVKPTLIQVAAKELGLSELNLAKTGKSYGLVWGAKDGVSAAKLAHEFAKGSDDRVHLSIGVIDGEVVSADVVKQLAMLPSYEELMGRVVGSMNAPISNFVYSLNWNLQSFYNVIKAIQTSK